MRVRLVELKFWVLVFVVGVKAENTEEKNSEQEENQQQTQPIYGTGWEASALTTASMDMGRSRLP